ncbi:hypothetical protein RHSIM_Rhsim11G0026900 [Rhododendron simsii]|uniref:Rx N-terminal domain-containing protein n=1 Tax=Rhododendron simsii TaxID=118357 RepID=A0A834LAU8_RHOSS|nr:hypothetical protein RHSIM_Rhsim11G0026900 [Rhododendron simsii]
MALSFLPVVLQNLNSLIQTEVGLLWGVDKEMKKLSSMLSAIEAVLEDAERKQLQDKAIQDWLRKLKGAAYEVDDILDDCETEALRWETKGQTSSSLKKVSTSLLYPFENIKFRHKVGNRMKAITEDLSAIAEERNKFHLREAVVGKRDEFADSRETSSFLTQSEVYGRDEDKQKIVKVLVEDVYECHVLEKESSSCIPKQRIHHITLLGYAMETIVFPKSLESVKSLRSILLQYREPNTIGDTRGASYRFSCDFSKLRLLRAFDARGAKMVQLSSSIGNLKHLRFLNLSHTSIQSLPKSICGLLNLQTLNLIYCKKLRRLPKNLKCLRSLRHLYLEGCREIHDMPPKLGQLTLLKTLSFFCVGKSGNQQLAELRHLDLGGELYIKHLERVRNSLDAKEANLVGKHKLRILKLGWSRNSDWESQANVEQLLEALGPHQNIEELFIDHYKGAHFPLWMRDSTLKNVVSIFLSECSNCSLLPPFGHLPSLRYLTISGMDYVEYIDNDFPGGGPVRGFPSLEELRIYDLPNLEGLSREEGRDLLPRLGKIFISNCPKLTLPRLSSSETLKVDIHKCSNVMLSSISNLNRLTSLTVDDNDDAISFPEEMLQNLTSLESLEICRFSKLKVLPTNLSGLVSLKSLRIRECHELESFPEHGLRSLKSLQRLEINHCNSLSSLSESLGHLTALEVLDVSGCLKLVAIPESIKHLGSLRHLTLCGGPSSWSYGEVLISAELKTLPEALQHVTSMQSLSIAFYPELTSLPEWLGNFSSLQSLSIIDSPKIQSLPQSIQSLTKLKTLQICGCGPELAKRCKKGDGEDWYKIAHIRKFYIPLLPTPSETSSTELLVASHVVLLRCRHAALTENQVKFEASILVISVLPFGIGLGDINMLWHAMIVYSTCIINSNTRVSIYRSDSKVCAEMNGFKGLDPVPIEEPFTVAISYLELRVSHSLRNFGFDSKSVLTFLVFYVDREMPIAEALTCQIEVQKSYKSSLRSIRSWSPLQGVTVGSKGVGNKGDACFLYVKQGVIVEDHLFACFVTDATGAQPNNFNLALSNLVENTNGE